jgi:hypothetical protein
MRGIIASRPGGGKQKVRCPLFLPSKRGAWEKEVWESFYYGLLELYDVPPTEWPVRSQDLKDKDIRWDLVNKAKEEKE